MVQAGGGVRTDWLRCFDGSSRSIRWRVVPVPLAAGTGLLAVAGRGDQQIDWCDPAAADLLRKRSTFLDLDQGIAMLRRAVHHTETPLDEVCDALVAVRPANSGDDATVVVTRLTRLQPMPVADDGAQMTG
ncbi:hypothetical protein ABT121_19885 [Streptomyces sp. NPDC001928]|uniref:hypothetical protein n=1 Tax=Streptomyces sp. NPDC001928 TaxID=3154404 RepID=UPI0033290F07